MGKMIRADSHMGPAGRLPKKRRRRPVGAQLGKSEWGPATVAVTAASQTDFE